MPPEVLGYGVHREFVIQRMAEEARLENEQKCPFGQARTVSLCVTPVVFYPIVARFFWLFPNVDCCEAAWFLQHAYSGESWN